MEPPAPYISFPTTYPRVSSSRCLAQSRVFHTRAATKLSFGAGYTLILGLSCDTVYSCSPRHRVPLFSSGAIGLFTLFSGWPVVRPVSGRLCRTCREHGGVLRVGLFCQPLDQRLFLRLDATPRYGYFFLFPVGPLRGLAFMFR